MIDDMDNQAAKLRELARKAEKERRAEERAAQGGTTIPLPANPTTPSGRVSQRKVPYTMAVTSGKGGVGKTLVSVNLAIKFAEAGLKVLIIDADLGLANIDVVLGLNPEHTMEDVLDGHKTLDEVVVTGPKGVTILPAASGVAELSDLSEEKRASLLDHIDSWNADFDVVIVDTGAGISPNVRYFILSVEKILVVATPDPASITDAYALMKVMYMNHRITNFELVVNQANSRKEALQVYKAISDVAEKFLNIGLHYSGFIPRDEVLQRAVREQKPVTIGYPECEASQAFDTLVDSMIQGWQQNRDNAGRATFFWRRVLEDEENSSTSEPESS
uniref:Putative GTPase involved in the synthesis of flagella, FlhG n=1 Tax=Magnetococcus massalia (strain MO-1) TaxID=451514 RepID=A0A1S7LJH8_MAGMO|nr:putative GTPase involved in the synthesis of flagella, FlhG [Candidatus Magnetococcus massalia]